MTGLALVVNIIGDATKLSQSLDQADGKVSAFGGKLQVGGGKVEAFGKSIDLGMVSKIGLVGGAVGIAAGALLEFGNAAAADRAEAQKLDAAITAAGAAHGDYAAQVDAAIVAGQAKAFTDTQSREALQSLVTATGDVTASTGLLTTAQDIARFAGVDLTVAADALAKAQAGQDTALTKLIPGLEKGATATDTIANASKMAAGQADIYAASTEGQMAKSADAFSELGETIGQAVLPILDALLPALTPILAALSKLITALLPVVIPLFTAVAKVLGVVADAVAKAAGFIADLVAAFSNALQAAKDFVNRLPKFPDIKLPFGIGGPAGQAATTSAAAGRSGFGGANAATGQVVNVNIYGGDPTRVEAAVARALQGYTRRNGPLGLAGMPGR